jgi:flavin reductase (DIM6/NTAB) family NADH-FMN oxidoreductase RutF
MHFKMDQTAPMKRYELLFGTVVPRPIALITSIASDATLNAAPYTFNVVSHEPPAVVFSVLPHPAGRMKDTAVNVLATKECVLNLVSEEMAEAMNLSCIDAPPEVSEMTLTGLEVEPSIGVKPPRISTSPVAMECRLHSTVSLGDHHVLILATIEHVHVADHLVLDAGNCIVDTPALKLFGAMHAAKFYARTQDLFEMVRPTWATYVKG